MFTASNLALGSSILGGVSAGIGALSSMQQAQAQAAQTEYAARVEEVSATQREAERLRQVNELIASQNAAIRALARETGARVVTAPTISPTMDGLHPDKTGVALWQERLAGVACAG